MNHFLKCVFLTTGTMALLNGSVALAEVNKCVGPGGKVLYGSDCPYGTEEQKKLKGTVSVGDQTQGAPVPKSGPIINSVDDSRAKEGPLKGDYHPTPPASTVRQ